MNCDVRVAVHVVGILNSLISRKCATGDSQRRSIDPSKATCLSVILSIACLPFSNGSSLRSFLGEGRVRHASYSCSSIRDTHSSFLKQYTTLSLSVFVSS